MPLVNPIVQPIVSPIVQAILGSIVPSFSRPLISDLGADATFTRASTAYVKDFEGIYREVLSGESRFTGARRVANLGTKSEGDITAGDWAISGGASSVTEVTGVTLPDGTTGAVAQIDFAGSTAARILSGYSDISGRKYALSFWVRSITGTISGLRNACFSAATNTYPTDVTTEWKRFTTDDVSNGTGEGYFIRNNAAGNATDVYVWGVQLEEISGQSNEAPGEYVSAGELSSPFHGANVDGVKYFETDNGNSVASDVVTEATGSAIAAATLKGVLIEGARTNSRTYSRDFSMWANSGTPTEAQDQVGFDGVANTAWTLGDDDGAVSEFKFANITIPDDSNTHCFNILIGKDNDETRFIGLGFRLIVGTAQQIFVMVNTKTGAITTTTSTGTVTSEVVDYNSSFWQVILTVQNNSSGNTTLQTQILPAYGTVWGVVAPAATGTAVFEQAQVELDTPFPSSPIPTTTVAVTRAQDFLTYAVGSWFNHDGAGSSIFNVYTPFAGTGNAYLISIDDDSASDRYSFNRQSGINTQFAVLDGGALQVQMLPVGEWADDQNSKVGLAWDVNDFVYYKDGASSGTDNAGTLPSGIIELKIGRAYNDLNPAFDNIKNFNYYASRLDNDKLIELTT